MANSKISALTAATTPLAGTEVLPVVQSSATTQVTVANLTAGRAVSALSYASTTGAAFGTTSGSVGVGMTPSAWGSAYKAVQMGNTSFSGAVVGYIGNAQTYVTSNAYHNGTNWTYTNTSGAAYYAVQGVSPSHNWYIAASGTAGATVTWTQAMGIDASGNITATIGNIVPSTAAKGVNFTANTPAAGMTSQLLNWYEEGTWTPNQGAGLTLVGAFSSTGKYTRIGRNVTVSGTVTGATSVAVTAAGVVTTNLPFTIGTAGHGNATNAAITASAAVICNTGTTLTSAGAIAATGTITFSATYFV